jgi:pilus assembly protein CpaB
MIGFAVLFGLLAVFVAQSWLTSQTDARMKSLEAQKHPQATQTIVVASKPLRFGNELSAQMLREPSPGSVTCCRAASGSCLRRSR